MSNDQTNVPLTATEDTVTITNEQYDRLTDEQAETQETIYSGVSITGKVKFGSETRDQGELHLKGKGRTSQEAAEDFEETLQAAEEGRWSDRMIALNPDRANFDFENVQGDSEGGE